MKRLLMLLVSLFVFSTTIAAQNVLTSGGFDQFGGGCYDCTGDGWMGGNQCYSIGDQVGQCEWFQNCEYGWTRCQNVPADLFNGQGYVNHCILEGGMCLAALNDLRGESPRLTSDELGERVHDWLIQARQMTAVSANDLRDQIDALTPGNSHAAIALRLALWRVPYVAITGRALVRDQFPQVGKHGNGKYRTKALIADSGQ